MNPVELHRWQWADYQEFHASRFNLWLHLFAVPLFLAGNLFLVAGIVFVALGVTGAWIAIIVGPLVSVVAMAIQGNGHKKEANPPKPFTGPLNVLGRIFVEQWVTFPRFVLAGGWLRALKATRSDHT